MEFGILAWGGAGPGKLKKISKLQKKCVRNIVGKSHRSHTDPIFSKLKILKFEDLLKFNSSKFMQLYNIDKQPESFQDHFKPFSNPNRTNNYCIPKSKNKFLEQFPAYFLPDSWNKNSLVQKNIKSHNSFKHSLIMLIESLISKYPPSTFCDSPTLGCFKKPRIVGINWRGCYSHSGALDGLPAKKLGL